MSRDPFIFPLTGVSRSSAGWVTLIVVPIKSRNSIIRYTTFSFENVGLKYQKNILKFSIWFNNNRVRCLQHSSLSPTRAGHLTLARNSSLSPLVAQIITKFFRKCYNKSCSRPRAAVQVFRRPHDLRSSREMI